MPWIVLMAGVLFVVVLAAALVAHAAVPIAAISRPVVRRWIVIPIAAVLGFAAAFFAVAVYFTPQFREDVWRALSDSYAGLPTTTILVVSTVVAFAVALVMLTIYGFLPQWGGPYVPRAARWNARRLRRTTVVLFGALLVALFLQDVELQWRLGQMEARALELAQSLASEPVPDEENAAVHYQRIIDASEELDELNDSFEDVGTGLGLCACDSERRKDYFAKLAGELSALQQAALCEKCRFDDDHAPVDLLDAMGVRYYLVGAAQGLVRLANYEICRQQPAEALALLRIIRRLEDHLAMDPRGTETVFYYWLEAWTCYTVERLATYCNTVPVDEARSLMAEPLNADAVYPGAIKWKAAMFQMSVVKTYDGRHFDRPETEGQLIEDPIGRALQLAFMRLVFARDDMRSMEVYFPFLEHPEDPDAWRSHDYMDIFPTGYILPAIESSSWAEGWVERANSWRQLTNIAFAAALYHQQHDRWPDAMERLVPDFLPHVPTDPLTGKSYHWINIDDGLVVYSEDDAHAFENFSDTREQWRNIEGNILYGSLFLGRAYIQYSSADYKDPNDPCAGTWR